MDPAAISREILEIRKRLAEIEDERARLLTGEYKKKSALQSEEYELRARLAHLRSQLSERDLESEKPDEHRPRRIPEIPPM